MLGVFILKHITVYFNKWQKKYFMIIPQLLFIGTQQNVFYNEYFHKLLCVHSLH